MLVQESESSGRAVTMKDRFYDELAKIRTDAAKNSVFITDASYKELVNDGTSRKIV